MQATVAAVAWVLELCRANRSTVKNIVTVTDKSGLEAVDRRAQSEILEMKFEAVTRYHRICNEPCDKMATT